MSSPGIIKKLEYVGRDIIAVLLKILFRQRPAAPPLDPKKIKSVCIMRIEEKLGDLLMTAPLIRSAAETFPNASITVLVAEKNVGLIEGMPGVDHVLGFNKRLVVRPQAAISMIRRLRARRYDLILEASSHNALSINSVILMKLGLNYDFAIGHSTNLAERFFDYRPPLRGDINEIRRTIGLLDCIEGAKNVEEPSLPKWDIPDTVEQIIAAAGVEPGAFMLVHPGAYRKTRRWNYAAHRRFCELVEEKFGIPSVVIFGQGEADEIDLMREQLAGLPIYGPDLTLYEVVGLMRRAAVVMTMNSGPMHLAVGAGAPTLAFAVGIDEYRWGWPAGGHLMLGSRHVGLVPEDVFTAAEKWLAAQLTKTDS